MVKIKRAKSKNAPKSFTYYLLDTLKPFSGHEYQSLGPEEQNLKNLF
jgi:hypothetical protein